MSPLVLVAVFAACVPDAKQIGENEWVIILDEPPDFMRAGPSGHVALVADTEIAVVRPDGARAGRVTLSGRVVDVVLDETGGLIALHRSDPESFESTLSAFADDGTLRWSVHRPANLRVHKTLLVQDVEHRTWIVPAVARPEFPVWERYDSAGIRDGGGQLAFRASGQDETLGAALRGGGLVIPTRAAG